MVCLLTQLLNNVHPPSNPESRGNADSDAEPSSEFAQCVEHINVLTLRLKNADERCSLLAANLRKVKATCAAQHSSEAAAGVPAPPPPLLLTSMMKHGAAASLSGSMSLPTTGSDTPPVLYVCIFSLLEAPKKHRNLFQPHIFLHVILPSPLPSIFFWMLYSIAKIYCTHCIVHPVLLILLKQNYILPTVMLHKKARSSIKNTHLWLVDGISVDKTSTNHKKSWRVEKESQWINRSKRTAFEVVSNIF